MNLADSWSDVWGVAAMGALVYLGLVLLLRVSGKRTLAQLNAFDWVVTVAQGSTVATTILAPEVALAEGIAALATLIGLQLAVTALSTRSARFKRLVRSEPTLLVHRGELLRDALRRERLTESEVLQALRAGAVAGPHEADAVVLETNGTLSVLTSSGAAVPEPRELA